MSAPPQPELPEGIVVVFAALPDADPRDERAEPLKKLADALMADHAASHSVLIIEAAISVFEEVLQLRPVEHECRAEALGDLGNALFFFCYHNEANHSRCARCIDLLRGALQLCPPGHSSRDRALHNLARALLFLGYEQQSIGCLGSLKESILLNREALQLRPTGHPGRRDSLNNLACGLQRLFENSGDLTLISESISMHRQALELGHRELSFRNLALALDSSFQHQGGAEAHAEAIRLNREALKLVPVGHPLRWAPLMNLGNTLARSYATTGFPEMLSESIRLHREAVRLLPLTHRDYGLALGNLADSLVASLRHDPDPHVLAEAITFLRHSLHLPSGESDRADRINSLAEALVTSFDEHNELDHLHEAVKLHREALVSRPPGHFRRMESLQGLGRLLCRTECQSWTEALAVYREALDNCPTGSPHRSGVLSDISRCFLEPASPFFDLQQGITYLSDAFSDNFCHVNRRLRLAMPDLLRLESTLNKAATSLDDYNSSLERCNAQVLDLYSQVISLLPRAANFGLDHSTRLQAVTGLDEISRNAAARAIILRRESEAVEMLEEGRGVFWAQALHLRTSAFDDVPQEDRQELQRLLSLLEHSARRVESSDKDAAQREYDLERRRQLNEQAEALISKIRCYAGLDRFLLPPIFETLVHALPDGFVAIVNASKLGYHALLLHRDTGLATSITLQSPPKGFDSAILRSHLPRDVGSAKCEVDVSRAMRKDNGRGGSLLDMLAVLWTSIVQPVVAQLGLQRGAGRDRPRLWWCVTGELGFLPIHAAGSYREPNPVCAADYVTSSYIPTLSSLTKASAGWKPLPRTQLGGLLICEESSHSERARYLPQAAEEVRIVQDCFDSAHVPVLNAPSAHTSRSELRSLLVDTSAHILHLACHGIHASDPLSSALVLQDGNLTIQDIMDLYLPGAVLAVLSACQTAKGDRDAPDQAIHLAASMLFCGFRSVIGTMWLMHDEDGPKVARAFYEALFRREVFDLDDVPYALDEAIHVLRMAGVPAQRWALFMHMGG